MKLHWAILSTLLAGLPGIPLKSQVYLSEGFESYPFPPVVSEWVPDGWSQEYVVGPDEPWQYRNGGHTPDDPNWSVDPDVYDPRRNPPSAYEGTYNAIFFKQSSGNERTKLITPEMDIEGGIIVELSFYLCQVPWDFGGSGPVNDVLRVYYKKGADSAWVLLQEYLDPIYDWELQTLVLPEPTSTYYVAFEGQTRWSANQQEKEPEVPQR